MMQMVNKASEKLPPRLYSINPATIPEFKTEPVQMIPSGSPARTR